MTRIGRLLFVGTTVFLLGCPPDDPDAPDTDTDTKDTDSVVPQVDINFFLLLHTGEGGAAFCPNQEDNVAACYLNAPPGMQNDNAMLAAHCAAEEEELRLCELTLIVDPQGNEKDDPSEDKNCKLENFDITLDRTDKAYDHRLRLRYENCRDGLKKVLEGLETLDVKATVQFHGGFLENLMLDEVTDQNWSFADDLVGRGHEIALHHHSECELSTADSSVCQDVAFLGLDTSAHGTAWGKAQPSPGDDKTPQTQAVADTRIDSLMLVVNYGKGLTGGYFAENDVDITSLCGWGLGYRLHDDMVTAEAINGSLEEQPQFTKFRDLGIPLVTTGNEFPIDIESRCNDG
ncbi:MAG: hypothetical protein HN348_34930, partial [Proteobacteria bacterium]|nr:hypothetical protein [Pseudomonadota bacterium]